MKTERITYPDLLRIVAIFFVIVIHITSVGLQDYAVGTAGWIWSGIFNSLSHWSVPVFFMVSGMFFLNPEKKFDLKIFYKKNICRILLCIVICGFLYSLLDQCIYGTISAKSFLIAIYGIVTGNTGYHLWFLYTLLILYIATPAMRVFTAHATKKQLDYALWAWFILEIVIGQTHELIQEVLNIHSTLPYKAVVLAGYAGYYLLGYRLKAYPLSDKARFLIYCCGAASLLAIPSTSIGLSIRKNTWVHAISTQLGVGQCIIAASVFSLAQRLNVHSEKITWLGQRVFGIYLVHVLFISFLFRILKLPLIICCAPLSILGYSGVVLVLSLLTSWGLSKIL